VITLEDLDKILKAERGGERREHEHKRVKTDGGFKEGVDVFHLNNDWHGGLTELRPDFYAECAALLTHLDGVLADVDNYNEEAMVRDEIRQTRLLIEGITNRRLGKITDLAAIVADGAKNEVVVNNERRMVPEEREAYDAIVLALKRVRRQVNEGGIETAKCN
jgi:DNA replication initiation complex subunit (GINS family)